MEEEQKANILLVDDRPENLLALEAIIERSDYNLIKASSGEEALIHLLKYDFAVILLDVQMPGVDGVETARIIKAREKTKNIPIIFITANNIDSKHIFTGYSVGAIDYILKPFDPFILKAKVEIFVEMYKIYQNNIKQAQHLAKKTRELEAVNKELSNITNELRESEALANVIGETSIDSMIVTDQDGVVLKVNPAFERMFSCKKEEIVGKNILSVFSDETSKYNIENVLNAINHLENLMGYTHIKEIKVTRTDNTWFYAEIQIGKRYVKNKCIVAFTIRDITKAKKDKELISHMAYHDVLTNLPNRRLFNDRLNQELKKAKEYHTPLSLLYIDMDRFKFINDSLGHLIGDRVLQEIAKRIVESVGVEDIVARIGGDEFNILLSATNREKAIEIAENIITCFKEPFYIDHYELFMTASIGISIFPYDGEDSLMLMKNADAALYRSKEQGKNMFQIYHSGMNIDSYKSFILQNDLRKAVERNELILNYQPRVNLDTGEINSAEALIRWNHPSWGIISPNDFIPLAEETGEIIKIGEWVLETACKQSNEWKKSGLPPIRVAVNFSPTQFIQKGFTDNIKKILTDCDYDPELLEIEVTETTLMENADRVITVLNELRAMGIIISIDDFGTGYSSLNYLKTLPIHSLKIDKSFIQDLSKNSPNSIALVSSILSIGNSLNLSVIAEGVETEEQLEILKKQNCKEIQGYLISRPVPSKEFMGLILKGNLVTSTGQPKTADQPSNNSSVAQLDQGVNYGFTEKKQEVLTAALEYVKELYSISPREMEVFELIIEGLSNKEISEKLYISEHTVKNHITRILQKLNCSDRLQAMAIIYQKCLEGTRRSLLQ